ncbi:hypothetical protein [Polymorphum gilvum]|uniref:Yip1 domain-containing protein n=1 Tax=Polymorphum gilvum (strain LMG 25793 / CGMCC 1.9160 / SL003B-26A1) TaxID=991905 RepID=F2J2P2_POLGS|nr:hypothetical protein [Polymorphum gilvum]ADZ72066.1 hypothetical protein SL003B_3645 [Polymorphum gilvum SL003B-26A1]
MVGIAETLRAIEASWALFRGRADAMRGFDLSIGGFWRSFSVVILLVPPLIVTSLAERRLILIEAGVDSGFFPEQAFWQAQVVVFGLDWILYPFVMAVLAAPLGLSRTYVPFVVARNWTSLLATVPFVIPALLYMAGLIPSGILVLLSIAALAVVAHYRYRVTRISLQASVSVCIGVVVLDLLLSLLIGESVARMFGL